MVFSEMNSCAKLFSSEEVLFEELENLESFSLSEELKMFKQNDIFFKNQITHLI